MSRVFKSSSVSVGKPLEVILEEEDTYYRKRSSRRTGSSDLNDPSDTASRIIEDAKFEAEGIIERAQQEADRIIQSAKEEANRILSQTQEQGYNEGYQKGLSDGKNETEDLVSQAMDIKAELEQERAELVSNIEKKVIDLVIDSVKKIVGVELKTNKELIAGVVKNALNTIGAGENITVSVSEEDFLTVQEEKYKILSESDNINDFNLKKDLSLSKGDCVVETDNGSVDAGIDTQVEKFEDVISELVGTDADEN